MKLFTLIATVVLLLTHNIVHADLIKQSATYSRMVYMQDSTASRSPGVASLTLTITASKAGGAFAAITPTVTDLTGGWYSLALTSAHTNTLGSFAMKITAAGVDETDTLDQIVAFDPTDASLLGLTGVATAASQTTLLTRIPGVVQPQTGDSFARLGAPSGASVSADIAGVPGLVWGVATRQLTGTQTFNLTGNISGNLNGTIGGYAAGQDPATLVLNAVASSFVTVGTIGSKINAAGSSGDPLANATTVYSTPGTIGYSIGQYLTGNSFTRIGVNGAGLSAIPASADPWLTALPAGYAPGSAGAILAGLKSTAPAWYTAPTNPTDYARNNASPSWYTAPTNPVDYARNNVAPGWYTSPTDPFGLLLSTSYSAGTFGNLLKTNLQNPVPNDYQQRGLAVTLPTLPPVVVAGYSSGVNGAFYAPVLFSGTAGVASLVLSVTANGAGQALLSWTADSTAIYYKVIRSTDGVNYTVIASNLTGTTYTDASPPGGNVRYSIISVH